MKKTLNRIFWIPAIVVGMFLLILGPASAYIEFTFVSNNNVTNLTSNVGSNLNLQVAMGFALFVIGLMSTVKGIHVFRRSMDL